MSAAAAPPYRHIGRRPPGPRGHLLFGIVPDLYQNPLATIQNLHQQYGDIVHYRLGTRASTLVVHPVDIAYILHDRSHNFVNDHSGSMLDWVLGNDLFSHPQDLLLRQGRLTQPSFYRQRVDRLGSLMTNATTTLLDSWVQQTSPIVNLRQELAPLTLQVVLHTLFGIEEHPLFSQMHQIITQLDHYIIRRFTAMQWRLPAISLRRQHQARDVWQRLYQMVYQLVVERRQHPTDGDDLMSMFIKSQAQTTAPMTDAQICDQLMPLLLFSYESTTTTLCWALILIAQHPEVEAHLHEEVDSRIPRRAATADDLCMLPYTRMVIDETLRLYPPVYMMARKVLEADEIQGYHLPAGSSVDISPYLTHRHPLFWPNPEQFDPERFAPERAAERPPFAYFPWNNGPRHYVGNYLALMEMQIALATMASRYRFQLLPGYQPAADPLLTLCPHGDVPVIITER